MSVATGVGAGRGAVRGVSPRRARRLLRELRSPQARIAYLFLLPSLLPTLVFLVAPMVVAAYLSFRDYDPLAGMSVFIGFENYTEALRVDFLFWIAVGNTLKFVVGFVPLNIALGLAAALVVNRRWRGIGLVRGGYYLPHLAAGVVVAFIWLWLFTPSYGLINIALEGLGLPPVGWMHDPDLAILIVIIAAAWQNFPGAMVIFLAGLQGVPEEIYAAAKVDGAGRLDLARHITLPLLRPVTFYLVVVGVVGALQVFDVVNVVTRSPQGISSDHVTTLVHQIYLNGMFFNRMGYAAAEAMLLFVSILALTYVNFRVFRRDIEY
jgi:ABC-type sugar transport system permease subunit